MVPTLTQIACTSSGNPRDGISRPSKAVISIFSAPCGYFTGNTSTVIGAARRNRGAKRLGGIRLVGFDGDDRSLGTGGTHQIGDPRHHVAACSSITRWSVVRYGSHSAPLITNVSTCLPSGIFSLACVGKPAPPSPTTPAD